MVLKMIDLFAGAGGLTLGFSQIRESNERIFTPVWANDYNKDAVATYNANFGAHCVHGDINALLAQTDIHIPQADLVVGGPPCQGFSLLNKNRALDPRKAMWLPYMEIVKRSGAKMFLMENVPELLASEEFLEIKKHAEAEGFKIQSAKLIAADYGVPQVRTRAFIFGSKLGKPDINFPPLRTHYNPNSRKAIEWKDYIPNPEPWTTVRDAIGDLPEPIGTEIRGEKGLEALHFGRNPTQLSLDRYRAIPDEGMNRFDLQRLAPEITPQCWIKKKSGGTDLFGRLWWDRPSVTIRTEFFKPEKGRYLHPIQHRPITHREAARIQGFPDDFEFKGTKTEIAKQIGNAVPVGLAYHVANAVLNHFLQNNASGKKRRAKKPEFIDG